MDEEMRESIHCLMQHLKALLRQSSAQEIADFGEPCGTCKLADKCKYDWIKKIEAIRPFTDVKINVAHQEH